MNRLEGIIFGQNPVRNMDLVLSNLSPSTIVPKANKYYTFIYKAKTRGIEYDMHPLILCGNVYRWGFNGDNYHMGLRQYTWNEVLSNLYELSDEEFQLLQDVPLAKIKST